MLNSKEGSLRVRKVQGRGDAHPSSLETRTGVGVFSLERLEETWFYRESHRNLVEGRLWKVRKKSFIQAGSKHLGSGLAW